MKTSKSAKAEPFLTLGEFAHQIMAEQFQRIAKKEKSVLADKDPENLHQMRVGTRRLRTALQVFANAVKLPKVANAKQLRNLARVLGAVRDLDVQIANLKDNYYPHLNNKEQKKLDRLCAGLKKRRKTALAQMRETLEQPQYQQIKTAYQTWIDQPQYTELASLPLSVLLPDILSPLLSELLLHPGWLIGIDRISPQNSETLHDLRKACKHVRYQTEFFTPFYGEEFNQWIGEIKQLQDELGTFQDIQVLQTLLAEELGSETELTQLQQHIQQQQKGALSNWEEVRQKYLDEGFRYHLHGMLLQPSHQPTVHPELLKR